MTSDTKSPSARQVAEKIVRQWGTSQELQDLIESALLSFAQSARQEQRERDAKIAEEKARVWQKFDDPESVARTQQSRAIAFVIREGDSK